MEHLLLAREFVLKNHLEKFVPSRGREEETVDPHVAAGPSTLTTGAMNVETVGTTPTIALAAADVEVAAVVAQGPVPVTTTAAGEAALVTATTDPAAVLVTLRAPHADPDLVLTASSLLIPRPKG